MKKAKNKANIARIALEEKILDLKQQNAKLKITVNQALHAKGSQQPGAITTAEVQKRSSSEMASAFVLKFMSPS
jgi:hypothetical protein